MRIKSLAPPTYFMFLLWRIDGTLWCSLILLISSLSLSTRGIFGIQPLIQVLVILTTFTYHQASMPRRWGLTKKTQILSIRLTMTVTSRVRGLHKEWSAMAMSWFKANVIQKLLILTKRNISHTAPISILITGVCKSTSDVNP
ncbi:hypothetical protein BDP27DRAFT_1314725 [Rhodocollybia butyracea]|uniref:Uncharacterized protein n=1 Tax=Rhodocollybia butyracea TaxID=206335 RepID=A0A9P5UE70_9AGAR|nr:hypothetical protein BDP27DRAFT_1314725 [Rhodocollybia butyracea]